MIIFGFETLQIKKGTNQKRQYYIMVVLGCRIVLPLLELSRRISNDSKGQADPLVHEFHDPLHHITLQRIIIGPTHKYQSSLFPHPISKYLSGSDINWYHRYRTATRDLIMNNISLKE